jgi:hypothetical protein
MNAKIWKDIALEVLIYELYCLVSDIVSYKKIDGMLSLDGGGAKHNFSMGNDC